MSNLNVYKDELKGNYKVDEMIADLKHLHNIITIRCERTATGYSVVTGKVTFSDYDGDTIEYTYNGNTGLVLSYVKNVKLNYNYMDFQNIIQAGMFNDKVSILTLMDYLKDNGGTENRSSYTRRVEWRSNV